MQGTTGDSNTHLHCVFVTIRIWLRHTTLGYIEHYNACKCLSKVCHVHVVLSTLYQEKIVTEQELENLKPAVRPWNHLVCIQCKKPFDVVIRTAELLDEVGINEEANLLTGQ